MSSAPISSSDFWDVTYTSKSGALIRTQLFFSSLTAVRDEIISRDGLLLHAEPYKQRWFHKELFSTDFKLAFIRGLTMHISAGASPGQALSLVVQTIPNPRVQAQLTGALDVLLKGGSFSEGLRALNLFDDAVIGMLVAGEMAGDISGAIAASQQYLEEQGTWLKAWKPFALWVGSEIQVALSGLWWMSHSFIPDLWKNLPVTKTPQELDGYKAALEQASLVCDGLFWATSVFLVVVVAMLLAYRYGSKAFHDQVERGLLAVPGMRSLILDASLALTFGLLSQMLKARLKFSEALPLVIKHSKTPSVKEFWEQVAYRLGLGTSLPRAFEHRFVESHEKLVLAAHQDSEQLSHALTLIALRRTDDARRGRIKALALYTGLMGGYIVAITLVALWLLKLQGAGMELNSVDGMMGLGS